jgi:hypothetical protein
MSEDAQRAAFELYMQNTCAIPKQLFARDPDGKYINTDMGWAWIGWQGASAGTKL